MAKFEECLQRLEKIVQELEKGEVPLEKSLTLFEEGMQLSSSCRKELEQAEGKVEILLKKNGKLQAEPFEPILRRLFSTSNSGNLPTLRRFTAISQIYPSYARTAFLMKKCGWPRSRPVPAMSVLPMMWGLY